MNKFRTTESRKYNKLKSFWRLLLKNSCDLSSKKTRRNKMFDYHFLSEKDIVKLILSYDKTLERAYDIYQKVLSAIKNRRFNKLKNIIKDNYEKVPNIIKVSLKTYKKYLNYIENSLVYEFSNGIIEGINRSIKVLKNTDYGYKSFFNFRNRILIRANLITEK